MGSSESKEVEQNPNFNIEQYNQKIANSGLYSQSPMQLPNEQDYYLRDNGFNPKPVQVEQSTVSKINLNFSLIKHSLTITREGNRISVSLKYTAKKQGLLKIYFMAVETEEEELGITSITGEEEMTENIQPTSAAGFSLTRQINTSGINALNLERKNNQGWYPFIISIGDHEQKIVTYVRTVNNFQDTVIIKQKIESQGKSFYIQEVFGLSKNSEERLCIICYSEPSDVIIFPCGHMCLCFSCCGELMRTTSICPICRKSIQKYQRIKSEETK